MEQDKFSKPFYALITDALRERIINSGFPHPVKKERYRLHVGELALFNPDVLEFYKNLKNNEFYVVSTNSLLPSLEVMFPLSSIDLSGKSNKLFATCRYQEGDIPLVLHSMFERQADPKGKGYLIAPMQEGEFAPLRSQELGSLLVDEMDFIRSGRALPDRYPGSELEDAFRHLAVFPILMINHIGEIRVECAPRTISQEELRQEQEHADRMQAVEEADADNARARSKIMHQVVGAERF